jgi:hypothetical protein
MPLHNPYQVQETDRDLLQIAEQQKLNFSELKQLNPNITSISPGQFISVPKPATGLQYSTPAGPPAPISIPPGVAAAVSGLPQLPMSTGQSSNQAPVVQQPYGPPKPVWNSAMTGDQDMASQNDAIRIYNLQTTMQSATDPSQMPSTVSNADAARLGYSPAQMKQAGYVMRGDGNWVNANSAGGGGGGALQSGNNWQTNDALHIITFNRNAKNKHSKFETNLKWAKNAWKRQKRRAKGEGARTEPANFIRGDTPSTTLDLILGS